VTSSGWWFSPVSSTSKTDRHDINEILLKVALNTITIILNKSIFFSLVLKERKKGKYQKTHEKYIVFL
jgi:hypothetical protein